MVEADPGVLAATQAEMETATSTSTYVSPGRAQYHPSGAKAFCSFNGSGTPAMRGTPYNFSSTITDLGTGLYTLTFTNNLSNDTYCVIGTSDEAGASQNNEVSVVSQSTSQITIRVARGSDNVPQDAAIINVVVFGDI